MLWRFFNFFSLITNHLGSCNIIQNLGYYKTKWLYQRLKLTLIDRCKAVYSTLFALLSVYPHFPQNYKRIKFSFQFLLDSFSFWGKLFILSQETLKFTNLKFDLSKPIIWCPNFLLKGVLVFLFVRILVLLIRTFLFVFLLDRPHTAIQAFDSDFNSSSHDFPPKLLWSIFFSVSESVLSKAPFLEGKVIAIIIHESKFLFKIPFGLFETIATFPWFDFPPEKGIYLSASQRIRHWNQYNFIYWGLKIF